MSWRKNSPTGHVDQAGVEELVRQLETGAASAETRLCQLYLGDGPDERDDRVLDTVAVSAARGSAYSLELLLAMVDDHQLAAPAVRRHVRDESVAEDVHQEVLMAVARSIHRYRADAKFTTWLYSLARNLAVSEIRRQRPTAAIDDDGAMADPAARRLSSVVAERDRVREAIASLPAIFRDTLILRDIERLSYAEIAERQGLALNTVRSRLSRGRALLAAQLPELANGRTGPEAEGRS